MARRMPKSFFWIDQRLIRSGLWVRLSSGGKLSYVALSATADRDGRCLWGKSKLAELAGGSEDDFEKSLAELCELRLIEVQGASGAVQILSLEEELTGALQTSTQPKPIVSPAPPSVIVHTHLTVNLAEHAER